MTTKASKVIIGRFGPEILLKTKPVRSRMLRQLIESLKARLKLSGIKLPIANKWDKFVINLDNDTSRLSEITSIITTTFGVEKIYLADQYTLESRDHLDRLFIQYFAPKVKNKTFGVRVRVKDNLLFSKHKLESRLGGLIFNQSRGVDLTNPDIWVRVWIDSNTIFFVNDMLSGPSGMPLGTSDKALVLFSGGIDSPVAAWLAARKGLKVNFLLLTQAGQVQLDHVKNLIIPLYRRWFYPLTSYFFVFPGLPVSTLTTSKVPPRLRTLMFKRILYHIAYHILEAEKIKVMVTGESLNQVSTQTPSNLAATQSPVPPDVLLIRPLIGLTKLETIQKARFIKTLSFSEQIPEYCIRSAQGSVTRFTIDKMKEAQQQIMPDIKQIIRQNKYQKINLKEIIETS